MSDEMSRCSCNDIVGYRFHPSDKELIDHYLWNKALDRDSAVQAIGEITGDLCDYEPERLPGFSVRRSNDQVWYLFCRRHYNKRVKRTTKLGFWKLTGRHRQIKANVGIGTKKTLVFYEGRVSKGKWTPWVIHEYSLPDTLPNQKGYFLCKLKRKEDEKAGIPSGEEGQPSNVADDKIFDNSREINIDELLAQLEDTNDSNKVEDEVASAQKLQMYGDFDEVQNQSNTNEQDDEFYLVSSTQQSQIHEEHVPFYNDFTNFCGSNGNFRKVQNQSSTNEQDDEFYRVSPTRQSQICEEYVPSYDNSTNFCSFNDNFHEVQNQSSTNEQDDEFWKNIFIDNEDDA
ncbi:NAC domain-containing protein 62-like isoform X2 [Herrania umbratica]|uniref:NAC domain-containing protein 62-like isoform X2 n=1 Tax=Herrania umbratica TaxID=108875 RepID=A0A6J0ZXW7_9ROSI|nr:NAC domain-containing protein 62-like isoform X2 [Herrania umbratica]